jgi:glycosyltransferase involved in cell wall biosynthesis
MGAAHQASQASREARARAAPVYLVLPPGETKLGGAEKRLVGMWLHARRQGAQNLRLVVNDVLAELLGRVDEFDDFDAHRGALLVVRKDRFVNARLAARLARLAATDRRALFHLAMFGPGLSAPVPRGRTLYTLAAAHISNFSRRGQLDVYRACLLSAHVDCLDGDLAALLRRRLSPLAGDVSVTPGSFVDLDRFTAPPAREKQNRFVFLGAFIPNKQVMTLLDQLPALHARLVARGFTGLSYDFLGRDSAGLPSAVAVIERLKETVPVRAFYATRPHDVLRDSKVFFSLQRLENYPSKALLEAMAAGCLPIVTDVGKSRQVASDDFAWFVPGAFGASDLETAATAILSLSDDGFDARVGRARDFLRRRFSVEATTDYYLDLYRRLDEERT